MSQSLRRLVWWSIGLLRHGVDQSPNAKGCAFGVIFTPFIGVHGSETSVYAVRLRNGHADCSEEQPLLGLIHGGC